MPRQPKPDAPGHEEIKIDVVAEFRRPPSSTRVSVVIPAYNAETTVSETLDSLLRQTHQAWEALVVDDGSNDGTIAIVTTFASRDSRIRLIRAKHGGEGAARNEGLMRASGDWVLFLDSDDWIEASHLEKMLARAASDPNLDAVHCGYARVARDGTRIVERYEPPTGDLFSTLARRAAFPVHACLIRRAKLQEVGGFDSSLRTSTDWDLWQRVARTGANFGAVREVLALYRMQPHSASLNATRLFDDGLEVLRRGHAPDARVARPADAHAQGLPPDLIPTQVYYLLSWCAGLLIGAGRDPSPLFDRVRDVIYPDLNSEAIAQCVFESTMLPSSEGPEAWVAAWPRFEKEIAVFLVALESQSRTTGLAARATAALGRMILERSLAIGDRRVFLEHERRHWQDLVDAQADRARDSSEERAVLQATLIDQAREFERVQADFERERESLRAVIERQQAELTHHVREYENAQAERRAALEREQEERRVELAGLHARQRELEGERDTLASERTRLKSSMEQRLGSLLVNDLKLRGAAETAEAARAALEHRAARARLAAAARRSGTRPRVLTTICSQFPIYSQTFVHREVAQLAAGGFDVRLIYSTLGDRSGLGEDNDALWDKKDRLRLYRPAHEADFARYRARMPDRVRDLTVRLCEASGMSEEALTRHDNFLQAFTFTRLVQAYRPHYLHSYFFYDRSLMALVAGWLLGIPRGVTCYADHLLHDYELKVVPLHLELCDLVVATSSRIKSELTQIAPHLDPARILVKPNAIDTARFTPRDRDEPAEGQPYRLVCTARIDPKKGLLDLVEAVHLLRGRGHRVEAHIVGDVDDTSACRAYKNRLDALITERGLWGTVHLEGRQDSAGVRRFLDIAHIFVAPFVETEGGDKDGIPTSLLEAMASGLPVVVTDAGSIPEVIASAGDGTIVRQRDPAQLATAIEGLITDPKRRQTLGMSASRLARDRFDVRVCEHAFHEQIRRLRRRHQ